MLATHLTVNGELASVESLAEKGIWIDLVNPAEGELARVAAEAGILPDFLRAALDEEERSRLEAEDGQILILINTPVEGVELPYDTIPLGIVVTENAVATVCLKDNPILEEFRANRLKGFCTYKKTRFVLQLLFQTASHYLKYLRQIDKRTGEIENRLHRSMKNEELIKLLNLEKSLVYFTTSLKANEFVMEKLLKSQLAKTDPDMALTSQILKMYPE
ncbi:MAG: magnesium transporter CorA family protein, partial [Bacteroidota bacterium]